MQKTFVLYKWQTDRIENLSKPESVMKVFNALCEYKFNDKKPDLTQFSEEEKKVLNEVINA